MTLEEYEKVLEEKRKALLALKTTEERKVDSKEFASMQQLSSKKGNDEIFIKLVRLTVPSLRRKFYFYNTSFIYLLFTSLLLCRVLRRISVKRQLKRKRRLRRFHQFSVFYLFV